MRSRGPTARVGARDHRGRGQRLTALVEKLLDLSRLQGGNAEPRRQWCSVDELLPEAARTRSRWDSILVHDRCRPAARPRRPRSARPCVREPDGKRPALLRPQAVSVRARAVSGHVRIRSWTAGRAARGPDASVRRFLPRRHSAVRRKEARAGLAIVKGLVEANGGSVWAESLPGQGTSFVVSLPGDGRRRDPGRRG